MKPFLFLCLMLALAASSPSQSAEETARKNGETTQQVILFCERYFHGWLSHADPKTGLIPRNLTQSPWWNAQDAAADNYPFMALTAWVTDQQPLLGIVRSMLETEKRLTCRVDSLPDDFLFETQAFRTPEPAMDSLIFGAAEYAKDGLIPITEWMGPSPWLDRMTEMIRDIWKHAPHDSPVGKIPTRNVEVAGDLLQVMSRLAWLTGEKEFEEWTFRLADLYFHHDDIPNWEKLRLDDHGCEIISGLSEAYYLASKRDPERWEQYRPKMHAILDCVLEKGRNEDGLLYMIVNAQSGEVVNEELTDNWGYNYNAFLVVAEVDGVPRYREAVEHVLGRIDQYLNYPWEGHGADGYADSIEGCINLLNRIPNPNSAQWVDNSMAILLGKQRPDGVIEGWHGDGNSARTALMYALWKTQGVTLSPWRGDHQLGAVVEPDGTLLISLSTRWAWTGSIRLDRPRHSEYFKIPTDYARLNQFPEWFVAESDAAYSITVNEQPEVVVKGRDLWAYPLVLAAEQSALIRIRKQP